MYTVEKIENDIVVLEDRKTKELKYVSIKDCAVNIKENDILVLVNNIYIKNRSETEKIKKSIRDRFNRLKN